VRDGGDAEAVETFEGQRTRLLTTPPLLDWVAMLWKRPPKIQFTGGVNDCAARCQGTHLPGSEAGRQGHAPSCDAENLEVQSSDLHLEARSIDTAIPALLTRTSSSRRFWATFRERPASSPGLVGHIDCMMTRCSSSGEASGFAALGHNRGRKIATLAPAPEGDKLAARDPRQTPPRHVPQAFRQAKSVS